MHPDEQPPVERDEGLGSAHAVTNTTTEPLPPDDRLRHLRRVRIEEDQHRKVEHARARGGFADDVPLGAHDEQTFRLINQRKRLDELRDAELVVPELDRWKFWTKMNDWDSRNQMLERLLNKVRRREATSAEIQLLVVITAPAWKAVIRQLRRYGGVDLDPRAEGRQHREAARRANELDRHELEHVVQLGLFDAFYACPRPMPRRFFPWLKTTLSHRALEHIYGEICEHDGQLEHDAEIRDVLSQILPSQMHIGSPEHVKWVRTLDLPAIFEVAHEFATYARVQTACERAVDRLPTRQREVVRDHYYKAIPQNEIAERRGVAASTIRNTHSGALRNLRADDDLFQVLEAVGKVRDLDRRLALERAQQQQVQQAA